jgi:hypothetical protein
VGGHWNLPSGGHVGLPVGGHAVVNAIARGDGRPDLATVEIDTC